jgi:phenylacetate-CoA ligase
MLLEMNPNCLVEILDGQIVVSKDQLVPLLRYNTGDEGGLLHKSELAQNRSLTSELLDVLPETVLFVRGRASNAIIFYGTNLNIQDINQHFLSLPPEMGYSGLFTVCQVVQGEVTMFEFTVLVDGAIDPSLAEDYQTSLLQYLRGQSLEFEAKYANLTRSIGEDLIKLKLEELTATTGSIKHRYIID